jgi:hypothetical protein
MSKIVKAPVPPVLDLAAKHDRSQLEAERMRDVLLLLESLTLREEVAIKLIIDCLYDIGHSNAIDLRIKFKPFNRIAKSAAKISKPLVRIIAWRWFKRNCPKLIADWLYTQVKF